MLLETWIKNKKTLRKESRTVYRDSSEQICFLFLKCCLSGRSPRLPRDFKVLHNDLAAPHESDTVLDSRTWDRYIRPLQMSHSGFRKKWERLSTSLQQVYNKEWSRKVPNLRIRIRFIRYRYRYGPGSSLKLYYGSPGPALFFTLPEILNKFVLHLRNCYKQIIDWKEKFGNLILCQ